MTYIQQDSVWCLLIKSLARIFCQLAVLTKKLRKVTQIWVAAKSCLRDLFLGMSISWSSMCEKVLHAHPVLPTHVENFSTSYTRNTAKYHSLDFIAVNSSIQQSRDANTKCLVESCLNCLRRPVHFCLLPCVLQLVMQGGNAVKLSDCRCASGNYHLYLI